MKGEKQAMEHSGLEMLDLVQPRYVKILFIAQENTTLQCLGHPWPPVWC